MKKISIAAAGTVEVPAYLSLQQKGYVVRWEKANGKKEFWFVEKDGCQYQLKIVA